MKFRRSSILLLSIFMLVPIMYNSCSAEHKNTGASSDFSSRLKNCGIEDEMELFEVTYHPFLKRQCSTCHFPGGLGPGNWGSSGVALAFNSFATVGYLKISEYATDDGHNPPYTGSANKTEVANLKEKWIRGQEELVACNRAPTTPVENQDSESRLVTRSKAVNPSTTQTQTIEWDLNQDLLPNTLTPQPVIPGARLRLRVSVFQRAGAVAYTVSEPRIVGAQTDMYIESLLIKINGKSVPSQRTFYFVQKELRIDDPADTGLISAGSMVAEGEVRGSDVIAVSFGKLEARDFPPPPTGPKISVVSTTLNVNETRQRVDIEVRLSEPSTKLVFVDFKDPTTSAMTTAKAKCCRRITNDEGDPIDIDHFDRDYEMGTLKAIFEPGQTSTKISLDIIPDDRDEPNEVVHLELVDGSAVNGKVEGLRQVAVTIMDDDAPHMSSARTYSELMNPGGVLDKYCLRCHNSVDNRGGYDLTNHQQMLDKGIVIPGNTQSLMWIRMNSDDGILAPMPLNGLISDINERRRIEYWILDGAKNN